MTDQEYIRMRLEEGSSTPPSRRTTQLTPWWRRLLAQFHAGAPIHQR